MVEPDEQVSEARRNDNRLEVVAAVVLGLAAIAIAWSGFQESQQDGENALELTESVRLQNVANDLYQQADAQIGFDHAVFVQVVATDACASGPEDLCIALQDQLSGDGIAAVDRWLENDDVVPFRDDEIYLDAIYAEGNEFSAQSDEAFDRAVAADEKGDQFGLISTFLSTVLFFAGISVVLDNVRLRIALLSIAGVLLIGSLIFLAGLQVA